LLVLLLGRIAVALTACGGLYLIRRKTESVLAHRAVASAAEVVGMAIFMLVVWFRPGELPWHAMSLCIMLIVIYVFIPNRLITAIGIALGATAAFIALAVMRGESRFSDEVTMAMLLLLTNSFGIIAARRYHRLWRDEYRALSTLKALSIRDHLTACFNRRHLHTTLLPQVLERARAERRWLTLMVCDIDHFKRVNDNHGHQGGDAVLMHVAMLLQDRIREPRDSVVRYGGKSFCSSCRRWTSSRPPAWPRICAPRWRTARCPAPMASACAPRSASGCSPSISRPAIPRSPKAR
jgi:GGDEF domain-containing protein